MHFYHSFPRCPNQKNHQFGLDVLDSILRIGLLIIPEERTTSHYKNLAPVTFLQRRVCFTALNGEPGELQSHTDFFGEFALEFEPDTLRELGALPAFYLNAAIPNGSLLHENGEKLLRLIWDAWRILGTLWHYRDNGSEEVKNFIRDYIFKPKSPGSQEAEIQEVFYGLETVLNLYYPTDNPNYKIGKDLGYYRQREWKVVPNWAVNNAWQYPPLDPADKAALLAQNHGYFSQVLQPDNDQRINLCQRFVGFHNERLLDRVKRLIVPDAVLAEAKKKVAEAGFKFPVVPLSSV